MLNMDEAQRTDHPCFNKAFLNVYTLKVKEDLF